MKKLITTCLALIITLSYSTKAAVKTEITIATSSMQTQVKNFSGVASGGSINVIIQLGASESIRFEGDRAAIAELVVEKQEDVLVIVPRNKKWWDWEKRFRNARVTAYISARTLSKLIMSGSGDMVVNGTLTGSKLSTVLSGSGKIKATASLSGTLESAISGSGTIDLQGRANAAEVAVSGSGNFNARNFRVNTLQAAISGSGNIAMDVTKSLEAAVSGSGNVRYAGNPDVRKQVAGSGSVTRL